jgi:hypothetical protein
MIQRQKKDIRTQILEEKSLSIRGQIIVFSNEDVHFQPSKFNN